MNQLVKRMMLLGILSSLISCTNVPRRNLNNVRFLDHAPSKISRSVARSESVTCESVLDKCRLAIYSQKKAMARLLEANLQQKNVMEIMDKDLKEANKNLEYVIIGGSSSTALLLLLLLL